MSQVPLPSPLSVALLDRLEREEQKLLCWGYTEGAFDARELEGHARAITDASPAARQTPGEVITELLALKWLFKVPNERRYRTRSAETIRLLSKLRQIRVYPSTRPEDVPGLWRSAPPLVADYRFLAPARTFPRRDIASADVETTVQGSSLQRAVLRAFIGAGAAHERKLSGFQVRAAARILTERSDAGTVVCSGTGSGKTLAFYLPAFLTLAPLLDNSAWTKCVAIYPRNELLKDQLREAIATARRVAPALLEHNRRGITFGAFFGDVKNDAAHVAAPKWGWAEHTFGGKRGRICPFLRCPSCGAPMFWADEDRKLQPPLEQLTCGGANCNVRLGPETIRLTRHTLRTNPPDVLFVSTEMLNRNMSASDYSPLFGIGLPETRRPRLLLLDEVHTCEGASGAHVALLLRRWRFLSRARPHVVGLSATLEDASRFFAELTGLPHASVVEVAPLSSELEAEGAEYQVAVRGESSWGTSLLSTTIQTLMLLRRVLAPRDEPLSLAGRRVFAFTDRLDGINRLLESTRDAEGRYADSNNPRARGTVLAGLRRVDAPDHDARYADGQAWDLVANIGHRLELTPTKATSLVVGRTTAQDTGVDPNADVVVATASLEVGYDDPSVGAVIQHKAPRSAAAFLQRKGRAGRLRQLRSDGTSVSMRPWTVVVLSDFGKDRIAYQDYEHIFSPTLRPRYLPTRNRSLLRMQATYALFDFLGAEARRSGLTPEPWIDLARPAESGRWGDDRRARQAFYEKSLRKLVDDREEQERFARFVMGALSISADEVQALLWESPRSVMLEAVPTLLRRLAETWKRAFETSLEPAEKWGPPLPEFVQRSLFARLLVPDVKLLVPRVDRDQVDDGDEPSVDEHEMVLAEAFREFAPGRVSKRFDLMGNVSHWIDPGEGTSLAIESFSSKDQRSPLGRFSYSENGSRREVDVYQPVTMRASVPPSTIQTTSNARPAWRTELVSPSVGHSVDLPEGSTLQKFVAGMVFHTHHLGNPVEVRRFVVGAEVSLARTSGKRESERRVNLVDENGASAAIGWSSEVDALAVQVVVPVDLLTHVAGSPELLRSLRPQRFRALVRGERSLHGVANSFQRDALVDAYLAAILLALDSSGASSLEEVNRDLPPEAIARAVALVSDVDDEDSGDGEGTVPRRVRELQELAANESVVAALQTHGAALWEAVGDSWIPWLRSIFRATLAAALRDAILALCPQIDEDDLIVEGEHVHAGTSEMLWVTEAAVGGSGALEAFYASYARDPRHFARLWHGALEAPASERVAVSIEQILDALASDTPSERVVRAVARVRAATQHSEALLAVHELREALTSLGLYVEHATLTILFARVLRPGSSPDLDAYLRTTLLRWHAIEDRAGFAVEPRTLALLRSSDPGLENLVPTAPQSNGEVELQQWRYETLRGLLWRRPASIRRDALGFGNAFIEPPVCERLIVPLPTDASPTVSLGAEAWFDALTEALNRSGVVRLVASREERGRMAEAVRQLAVQPIDTGGLHVYARLAGYTHDAQSISLTVEMPEALQ